MKLGSRALAAALALSAGLAVVAPAAAQNAADRETARALFDEGKTKRDKGDWAGALEAFKGADAIMKVPTTKLAVARAYAALGKLTEARDAALQVSLIPVAAGETQAFTDARTASAQLATELGGRIPSVAITLVGAPPDDETQVTVDDVLIPPAALKAPRRVNPGKHVVVASLRGGDVRAEVELAEKETKPVSLDVTQLAKRPKPVAVKPTADQPAGTRGEAPGKGSRSPLLWVGLAVTGVGLGVGATAGVISMGHTSDLDAQCRDGRCPPGAHTSLDDAKQWATISTIGFAAAGAGLALAGVGLALGRSGGPQKGSAPHVETVVTAGGAALRGSF